MQKEHLALAMDYAAAMEACASYCQATSPSIRDPDAAYRILAPLAHAARQEVFWTLLLNTKNRLVAAPVEATRGLLDSCPVHPREVFREAVRNGQTAAVILAHNHPLCGAQHNGCYAEYIFMRSCQTSTDSSSSLTVIFNNCGHAFTQHNFVEFHRVN